MLEDYGVECLLLGICSKNYNELEGSESYYDYLQKYYPKTCMKKFRTIEPKLEIDKRGDIIISYIFFLLTFILITCFIESILKL